MGLSIHYRGSLNDQNCLTGMIEEVKDIAEIYKWPYHIYKSKFPGKSFAKAAYNNEIYGISFAPPGCETVFLCFLSNGRMSSPIYLQFYGNSKDKTERESLYMLSVKTQFAGIEIHKIIIQLFKHLSKKYLKDFTLSDEGQYWETGDETVLEKNFKRYSDLLDNFSSAIEYHPMKKGESFEAYFERLLKKIRDKNKK